MYFIFKTHTALVIFLFFFFFFFFFFFWIFNVLFKLKNEIFKGAKTEWSYTWMHQVLMNKIRTLGGTNHHVSLRVSNTPSPYNTLFVSLSALTLVCLSHHRVCWAVSFSWTAVERRSWSQFFLKMKHRRLFNQISYLVFSLLHFVIAVILVFFFECFFFFLSTVIAWQIFSLSWWCPQQLALFTDDEPTRCDQQFRTN